MGDYHLDGHVEKAYTSFLRGVERPVIGITTNHQDIDVCVRDRYHQQVVRAGGIPVLLPPVADESVVVSYLDHVDALLLTGGGDFDPRWVNEHPSPKLGSVNAVRDLPELLMTRLAYNRQMPVLGICRGMQALAMVLGGHVAQDISEWEGGLGEKLLEHSQKEDREECTHEVRVVKDTMLHDIFHAETLRVNSFHHQVVDSPGALFQVSAKSADNVIEAIESTEFKPILGVQWHPEWLGEDGLPLFGWLVEKGLAYRQAKSFHRHHLTLDSHCDTPMFFPENVDFLARDERILVNLPMMLEGGLDCVTMAAYLPQPTAHQTFLEIAPFKVGGPKAYADLIFDKVEAIVAQCPERLALARSAADMLSNKRSGRRSIALTIENGLALEGDIRNVAHFAHRGVVYITLCHNGDNDICDSARGTCSHGGLSPFGVSVVEEMNRNGVMVDLSHAAETSFYDVLEASKSPVVCSHSNCRALCDHPRNVTDDQLRALARHGGVVQITLYPGFLKRQGEASVLDVLAHLEHVAALVGIDHVGLGTDFDGDGGVRGMKNASELMNFTIQMLQKRFSEDDMQKIWGGNWMRVMDEVQRMKNK